MLKKIILATVLATAATTTFASSVTGLAITCKAPNETLSTQYVLSPKLIEVDKMMNGEVVDKNIYHINKQFNLKESIYTTYNHKDVNKNTIYTIIRYNAVKKELNEKQAIIRNNNLTNTFEFNRKC